ncbi:MAG: DUF1656 domain-containing protein [Caulobacteraceae bacterium]|nr:DUF1656 domain-containing protein [Caulobacteraceae bacterium]
MIGELSFGGVFVPTFLVLAVLAVALTGLLGRLLVLIGAYRTLAFRPLVDISLFALLLGLLVRLSAQWEPLP